MIQTETRARREFVLWLSALSLAGLARPLKADDRSHKRATAVAESWLALVDEGRYTESWGAAAPVFREAVTREQWETAVRSVRTPLGRCLSRNLVSRRLVASLPGAPKGTYVVIQFETTFEGKAQTIETVTPALGADGQFSVSGYFIRS
jgi:hypothetical protein